MMSVIISVFKKAGIVVDLRTILYSTLITAGLFVSDTTSYAQQANSSRFVASAQQMLRDPALPDDFKINLMIRSTIVALNQANWTGNYSVLRDLGTPGFQAANNPTKLADIFSPLRSRRVDLSQVIFSNPKLFNPPALQYEQILRLTGFFPTNPEQINFDLALQNINEQWLLAGIAVSTGPNADQPKTAQFYTLQAPGGRGNDLASSVDNNKIASAESKPIRIDLSEANGLPPKKPVAVRKPKPPVAAAAPTPDPTINNAQQSKTPPLYPEWQPQQPQQ